MDPSTDAILERLRSAYPQCAITGDPARGFTVPGDGETPPLTAVSAPVLEVMLHDRMHQRALAAARSWVR